MFSNLDSFTNSARNYYIYHNPVNGLWEWIKWDCNEAFGSYPAGGGMGGGVTDLTTLETGYYALSRPLLERIITIESTRSTYDYYYCVMKNTYFSNTYLYPKIDALDDLIREAVLADDNKMYTDAQYIENLENDITTGGGPGGGTIYGLKSFVAERNSYLDGAIDCSNIGQAIESDAFPTVAVFPNPTYDDILFTTNFDAQGMAQLFDINGALLQEIQINNTGTTISLRNYQAGVYVLKINTSDAIATTLIVKR